MRACESLGARVKWLFCVHANVSNDDVRECMAWEFQDKHGKCFQLTAGRTLSLKFWFNNNASPGKGPGNEAITMHSQGTWCYLLLMTVSAHEWCLLLRVWEINPQKKTSVIQLGFGLKTFWILVKHSYHLIEPLVVQVKTIKLRKQH